MSAVAAEPVAWHAVPARASAAYGLDPSTPPRLLSLSENATHLVRLTDGTPSILRVHRPGFRSLPAIRSELHWTQALAASGAVRTPAVRLTATGDEVHSELLPGGEQVNAVLFEFVDGTHPDEERAAENFSTLGQLTADLHRHARGWRRGGSFERPEWTLGSILGEGASWPHWRTAQGLDDRSLGILADVEAKVRDDVATYEVAGGERLLLHADLRAANLLIDRAGAVNVIDFDDCGPGWVPWDFACAVSFREHEPVLGRLLDAWVQGYTRTADLDRAAAELLPAVVVLRRLLLVGWMGAREGTTEHRELSAHFLEGATRIGELFLSDRFLRH